MNISRKLKCCLLLLVIISFFSLISIAYGTAIICRDHYLVMIENDGFLLGIVQPGRNKLNPIFFSEEKVEALYYSGDRSINLLVSRGNKHGVKQYDLLKRDLRESRYMAANPRTALFNRFNKKIIVGQREIYHLNSDEMDYRQVSLPGEVVDISPNGSFLVCKKRGEAGEILQLIEAETGQVLGEAPQENRLIQAGLDEEKQHITAVFLHDNFTAVTVIIYDFNIQKKQEINVFLEGHFSCSMYDPETAQLVIGFFEESGLGYMQVSVLDALTERIEKMKDIDGVAMIPSSPYLVYQQQGELYIYDLQTKAVFETGISGENLVITVSPNNQTMAVAARENNQVTLWIYDLSHMFLRDFDETGGEITQLVWDREGENFFYVLQKDGIYTAYKAGIQGSSARKQIFQESKEFKIFWLDQAGDINNIRQFNRGNLLQTDPTGGPKVSY
ncbi:TolB-like translocation protein [Candidatus Contubernalis alkaliaceticus]|uniref:WD40 repeat domain-containing protein n=1 Tax=Candidatus Contubernalis alkaliaceticus TaxID=338645 RepID=UPI001F4C43E4|nr:WD40 repeat domain-containing protein [Candidatus Contubernalis alkalaceticus]UNC91136.1 WD40 repeat domain-containing protein [Candidatus Contubernalis alkalaceticus]